MQKLILLMTFALMTLTLAGCHLVYTPDVQQGNLLTKDKVDQLKPGMTKRQVLALLGTPSVSTPFEQSRWDYVSTQQHRGGKVKIHTFRLSFNNDTLVRTDGDFFAQDTQQLLKDSQKYQTDYSVDEKKGDKIRSAKDEKPKGSFGTGPDSGKPPPGDGH